GYRDRGSPGGCGHQNDNGWWHGCRDKICFRCLFAEGSGKPTSPYPTLISSAPGVLHAHRQRRYETTPGGAANEKRVTRRAWNLTGTSGYARMIDAARLIECRFYGGLIFSVVLSHPYPPPLLFSPPNPTQRPLPPDLSLLLGDSTHPPTHHPTLSSRFLI